MNTEGGCTREYRDSRERIDSAWDCDATRRRFPQTLYIIYLKHRIKSRHEKSSTVNTLTLNRTNVI